MAVEAATPQGGPTRLEDRVFDDGFVRALPADPVLENRVRAVSNAAFSFVTPTPVAAPRLLAWCEPLAESLGLMAPRAADDPAVQILAGNRLAAGMRPYAARYGGHQFGHWAGQLGDGRAITLGEMRDPAGQSWELQLKGAGRTPYSRNADGRAVLRSSLREFLCSEAMFHLGVPTTRALSLVASGEGVVRDMFYDGRPRSEPGAIVCRAAPSFLRFGNFEILAAREESGLLAQLAEHAIAHHFPDIATESASREERVARWFTEVCRRTGVMIAHWMRVGFVHGVMNTDNMSILGLTIDYGPYGWLEPFDPMWTPNTTDAEGRRYCFGAQPQIAQWNLARLAGALLPLVPDQSALEAGLDLYRETFQNSYRRMYADKLGLVALDRNDDDALLGDLFSTLDAAETDMTLLFRALAAVPISAEAAGEDLLAPLRPAFYAPEGPRDAVAAEWLGWLRRFTARVRADARPHELRLVTMNRANPCYVPRNWLAQQAIDAAEQGDTRELELLISVLQRPYDEQPGRERFGVRRPDWARDRPGCSALSCSS
jgi:uncharacterized protein YdiU (UPF0061 family)